MANLLPETSEFETALADYGQQIKQDIMYDFENRGVSALPQLSQPELQLADSLLISYRAVNGAVQELERPDTNISVLALIKDGLKMVKRVDCLARLPVVQRSLVPPLVVESAAIDSYVNGLLIDQLDYESTRPRAVGLVSYLPKLLKPMPTLQERMPIKERQLVRLRWATLEATLLCGFVALDKVQQAEVEMATEAKSYLKKWPSGAIGRLRAAEVSDL